MPKKRWGLAYLNYIKHIFLMNWTLTGITSNFTLPKPPIQSKSICHHPHHKTGLSRSGQVPRQSEDEKGGRGAGGERIYTMLSDANLFVFSIEIQKIAWKKYRCCWRLEIYQVDTKIWRCN